MSEQKTSKDIPAEPPSEPQRAEVASSQAPADDDTSLITDLLAAYKKSVLNPMTRPLFLKRTLGLALVVSLIGICLVALVAAGSIYGIGIHAWWKLYKTWALVSPLVGPLFLLFLLLVGASFEFVTRRIRGLALVIVLLSLFAVGLFMGGYFGAREDHPSLASESADTQALSKSLTEQRQVLGQLSDAGNVLLEQLSTTQQQLEDAKKQLTITLSSFDRQKQAAAQVANELKRLDERQQAISMKTQELERILEGQKPITRQDLQHSANMGLLYGTILGFIGSLAGTYAWNVFAAKKRARG